jgi:preprotein translocase subunit SecG
VVDYLLHWWFSNGGVQKTTDFLDKSTWTLVQFNSIILLSSLSFTGTLSDTDSKIIENTSTTAPAATQYKTHQLQQNK